jgi:RimJ/RimL family protein N-acetyltransferase
MPTSPVLVVREMELSEIDVRVDYFHNATDDHLRRLGVDRASLPSREAWRSSYAADRARPIRDRQSLALVWELDGKTVGFSSSDRIVFGVEAYMHLHVLEAEDRHKGLGTEFVKRSARPYFHVLELERLFCEPNAFNVAPNRAVQKAGFRYLFSHQAQPSPINFFQVTTRWVMDRADQPVLP